MMREDIFINVKDLQKYGETNTLSQQAQALVEEQKYSFDLAKVNYKGLEKVVVNSFDFDGFTIKTQFNPERIRSSNAKTDAKSIAERPCFLCMNNLPPQQKGIPLLSHYIVLTNPFPIFSSHLTIPSYEHQPQLIKPHFLDLLEISKQLSDFTVFYNGPRSGASAPDHFHLQAGNIGFLPIEHEVEQQLKNENLLINTEEIKILSSDNHLRKYFVLQSANKENLLKYFDLIYNALTINEFDEEPMLNILSNFKNNQWTVVVFPRKKQRPSHFFKEGKGKIMVGPASVELGGVMILPREEDFEKITKEVISEIYDEITIDDEIFKQIEEKLLNFTI